MSSLFIPSLSALIFTCSADSSPETYSTLPSPLILSQSCKIKVDFPIPGSPPTSTSEPFTSPPIPVLVLTSLIPSTSLSLRGTAFLGLLFGLLLDTVLLIFSS